MLCRLGPSAVESGTDAMFQNLRNHLLLHLNGWHQMPSCIEWILCQIHIWPFWCWSTFERHDQLWNLKIYRILGRLADTTAKAVAPDSRNQKFLLAAVGRNFFEMTRSVSVMCTLRNHPKVSIYGIFCVHKTWIEHYRMVSAQSYLSSLPRFCIWTTSCS